MVHAHLVQPLDCMPELLGEEDGHRGCQHACHNGASGIPLPQQAAVLAAKAVQGPACILQQLYEFSLGTLSMLEHFVVCSSTSID